MKHCLQVLLAVYLCLCALPLKAATITVTNLNDAGAGSLRDAIASANNGDEIEFSVGGTIELQSQITINTAISILGPTSGAGITITTTSNSVRLFYSNAACTVANLTFSGVENTVNEGIVWYANADLHFRNVTVASCKTGINGDAGVIVISNSAGAVFEQCSFQDNNYSGNYFYASISLLFNTNSQAVIRDCVFRNNGQESNRGGIVSTRLNTNLLVERSVFANNTGHRAAIWQQDNSYVSVVNCLFLNNQVPNNYSGSIFANGVVDIDNCSFVNNNTENSGAVFNNSFNSPVTIRNSLFYSTTATPLVDGLFTVDLTNCVLSNDNGSNLVLNDCIVGDALPILPSNVLTGTSGSIVVALAPGSIAIDAGLATSATIDQRHRPRLAGTATDIGSWESNYSYALSGSGQEALLNQPYSSPLGITIQESGSPAQGVSVLFRAPVSGASVAFGGSNEVVLTTGAGGSTSASAVANNFGGIIPVGIYGTNGLTTATTSSFQLRTYATSATVTNTDDDGFGSLRYAINNIATGGTITIDVDGDLQLTSTPYDDTYAFFIDKNMSIIGSSTGSLANFSTSNTMGFFVVSTGVTLSLNDLNMAGPTESPSPVMVYGTLLWDGGEIVNCEGALGGGLYIATGATVELNEVVFNTNAASFGGGIYCDGSLIANRCVLYSNFGVIDGGGIVLGTTATAHLEQTVFDGNVANIVGGAIVTDENTPLTMVNCSFLRNEAGSGLGDAIAGSSSATCQITNTVILGDVGFNLIFGGIDARSSLIMPSTDATITGSNNILDQDPMFEDQPCGCLFPDEISEYAPVPMFNSPLIDAGQTTTASLDLRGLPRTRDGAVDIGATETFWEYFLEPATQDVAAGMPLSQELAVELYENGRMVNGSFALTQSSTSGSLVFFDNGATAATYSIAFKGGTTSGVVLSGLTTGSVSVFISRALGMPPVTSSTFTVNIFQPLALTSVMPAFVNPTSAAVPFTVTGSGMLNITSLTVRFESGPEIDITASITSASATSLGGEIPAGMAQNYGQLFITVSSASVGSSTTSLSVGAPTLVYSLADHGPGTLRYAIENAAPGDTITFDPTLGGGTITLLSSLYIDRRVVIIGPPNMVTVDGGNGAAITFACGAVGSEIYYLQAISTANTPVISNCASVQGVVIK